MLGTYEFCREIARSRICETCQHASVLLARHIPGQSDTWEVYCPRCDERERFIKPESLTSQWRRDPGSVNIAIANRLARKFESEIESVAEGLPPELAETVRRQYLPDTADTKETT